MLPIPNTDDACATTESAVMPIPATVKFKFPSEASESTSSEKLIEAALKTSALSKDGTLAVSRDASRASFVPARVPVSESVVVDVVPRGAVTVACAALACPATV